MSCREQLDEFKKEFGTEMESRNKELLLENAKLKKLLNEVHCEMRRLKEVNQPCHVILIMLLSCSTRLLVMLHQK